MVFQFFAFIISYPFSKETNVIYIQSSSQLEDKLMCQMINKSAIHFIQSVDQSANQQIGRQPVSHPFIQSALQSELADMFKRVAGSSNRERVWINDN